MLLSGTRRLAKLNRTISARRIRSSSQVFSQEKSCSFRVRIFRRGSGISKDTEILLVEDSKFIRVAVQRALTRAGYIVHTASDGEAGLLAARKTLPYLAHLDLVLPKPSGR